MFFQSSSQLSIASEPRKCPMGENWLLSQGSPSLLSVTSCPLVYRCLTISPPHFIKSVWIKWYSAQNSAKALVMANWTRWALLFPECQFICSLLLTWHSDLFKMNLCNLYSFSEVLQGMNLDGCCHLLYPTRKQKTSPRTRKFGISWDLSVGALLHLHIF